MGCPWYPELSLFFLFFLLLDTSLKPEHAFSKALGFLTVLWRLALATSACWVSSAPSWKDCLLPPQGSCLHLQFACPLVFLSNSNKMVPLLPAFLLSWPLNSFVNVPKNSQKGMPDSWITMGEWRPREICMLAVVKRTCSCPPSPKHLRLDTLGNLPRTSSLLHVTLTLAAAFAMFFLWRVLHVYKRSE